MTPEPEAKTKEAEEALADLDEFVHHGHLLPSTLFMCLDDESPTEQENHAKGRKNTFRP